MNREGCETCLRHSIPHTPTHHEPVEARTPFGVIADLIRVDPTHVIWPRNTEWEIFTVDGQRHHLGAIFALGHKSAFTLGAPPVAPIAEQVRREGALLDLDKHDWPWSMMLVPVLNVDFHELANNHGGRCSRSVRAKAA